MKKTILIPKLIFYIILLIILVYGIYCRIKLYSAQIPLFWDEMLLCSSFVNRELPELFLPLDYYQKAPPLFCCLVFLIIKIAGFNLLSLRFISFIAGLISLPLFFIFLKTNIKNQIGIITGFLIFSVSSYLIYYSAECKPYSLDVLLCIVLLLLYKKIELFKISASKAILYGIISMLFVLLSFPSIFIIPAIVFAKMFEERHINYNCIWIGMGLLCSGLYLYYSDINNYAFLVDYWSTSENFLLQFNQIPELFANYKEIYSDNITLTVLITRILLILTGITVFIIKKKRESIIYLLIILLVIFSSLMKLYPLHPRFLLFLYPITICIMVKNFDINYFLNNKLKYYLNILLIVIMVYSMNIYQLPYINKSEKQIIDMISYFNTLNDRKEIKKELKYLIENYNQENDEILTHFGFQAYIKVYSKIFGIDKKYKYKIYYFNDDSKEVTIKYLENCRENTNTWIMGQYRKHFIESPKDNFIEEYLIKNKKNYQKIYNNNYMGTYLYKVYN